MFDSRQTSDYGDYIRFEEKKVRLWLQKAELFIKEIDILINENTSLTDEHEK